MRRHFARTQDGWRVLAAHGKSWTTVEIANRFMTTGCIIGPPWANRGSAVSDFDHYNTKASDVESGSEEQIALWMLDTDEAQTRSYTFAVRGSIANPRSPSSSVTWTMPPSDRSPNRMSSARWRLIFSWMRRCIGLAPIFSS